MTMGIEGPLMRVANLFSCMRDLNWTVANVTTDRFNWYENYYSILLLQVTHHGEWDDSLNVLLHHGQLSHHLLWVRRRVLAPVVDVPVDPPGDRLAGEVLHLKVQLHHLDIGQFIPVGNGIIEQLKRNTSITAICYQKHSRSQHQIQHFIHLQGA